MADDKETYGFNGGEHFEGLGDVLDAVFGDTDTGMQFLPEVIANGDLHEDAVVNSPTLKKPVFLYEYPPGCPFRWGALHVVHQEEKAILLYSSYPVLQGIVNRLRIVNAHTWENTIEGTVAAETINSDASSISGPSISFFDPYYYRESEKLLPGSEVDIELACVAFSLQPAEVKDIVISDKKLKLYQIQLKNFLDENLDKTEADFEDPVLEMKGASIFLPSTYVPEWRCQCPVLAVDVMEFAGMKIHRIETKLVGMDDHAIMAYVYASEKVLGDYTPKIGDDVTGVFWISGYIHG